MTDLERVAFATIVANVIVGGVAVVTVADGRTSGVDALAMLATLVVTMTALGVYAWLSLRRKP